MQEKIKDLKATYKQINDFNHKMKDAIEEKDEEINKIKRESKCYE